MGIPRLLSATRRAIIRAANTRIPDVLQLHGGVAPIGFGEWGLIQCGRFGLFHRFDLLNFDGAGSAATAAVSWRAANEKAPHRTRPGGSKVCQHVRQWEGRPASQPSQCPTEHRCYIKEVFPPICNSGCGPSIAEKLLRLPDNSHFGSTSRRGSYSVAVILHEKEEIVNPFCKKNLRKRAWKL